MSKFKFVDLFCGVGGFHQAMASFGGECIAAAEIDEACRKTYKQNFKVNGKFYKDVREIPKENKLGKFDVLCAGFPCQPFSKAGKQKGFEDENRGDLFYEIIKILEQHPEVKFVILENVKNLAKKSNNWQVIVSEFKKLNFYITEEPIILSPHQFGIPQIRDRVYILGIRNDIKNTDLLTNGCIHLRDLKDVEKRKNPCKLGDAWKILDDNVSDDFIVSEEQELMIEAWDEFRRFTNLKISGFPIWLDYFGVGMKQNKRFRDKIDYINMPDWKKEYVDKNRKIYLDNKEEIDKWVTRYDMLSRNKCYKKFEWNAGLDATRMQDTIIQFRQSGIRAKRSNYYPSLVAMVNTPVIWDSNKNHYRYITTKEAAKLQSFDKNYDFTGTQLQTYKQLGNSVNVEILKILGRNLFAFEKDGWKDEL